MGDRDHCAECNATMESGFIPDASFMGVWQTCWHRGDAEQANTLLDQLKTGAGVKHDKKQMIPIVAFRCTNCGWLKFYATCGAG